MRILKLAWNVSLGTISIIQGIACLSLLAERGNIVSIANACPYLSIALLPIIVDASSAMRGCVWWKGDTSKEGSALLTIFWEKVVPVSKCRRDVQHGILPTENASPAL
jgi:hypothetical protein